jgi:hypothetical protein
MKLTVIALAVLTSIGCSTPSAPTPEATNGWIRAMAVDEGGQCIEGARFEVLGGQGPIGAVITQTTPCTAWSYGEGGVYFRDLKPSIPMILRASAAAGYGIAVKYVVPNVQTDGVELFTLMGW